MNERHDFSFDAITTPRTAVLTGVMRLESIQAYERVFQPMKSGLLASREGYTIDLREVLFMNSSGIRTLGMLVLSAKQLGVPLLIRGRASVPWQKKSLGSLKQLYAGLELQL
jgi:hypothetical protein